MKSNLLEPLRPVYYSVVLNSADSTIPHPRTIPLLLLRQKDKAKGIMELRVNFGHRKDRLVQEDTLSYLAIVPSFVPPF